MYIFAMYDINGKHFLMDKNSKVYHFATENEALEFAKNIGIDIEQASEWLEELTTVEDINEVLYGEFEINGDYNV